MSTISIENINNLKEARAEFLLNYLYPGLADKWIVKNDGTFYRNYSADILSMDPKERKIDLSRDGFIKMLPPGLLANEAELKKSKNKNAEYKKLQRELHLLKEFFLPIDSILFRKSLSIEREVSLLLQDELNYILKNYFHFDIENEPNKYIKKVAPLLLYVSKLRGNINFVGKLLTSVTGYNIELKNRYYSESDRKGCHLPAVQFMILIPNLTNDEFKEQNKELTPLFEFLEEWFLPFEMHAEFKIKHINQTFVLGNNRTLDYNTDLTPIK